MAAVARISPDGLTRWARVRRGGAVIGVLTLIGTAVLAPFSMSVSDAYAAEYEAAMIARHPDLQAYSTVDADPTVLDLHVDVATTEDSASAEDDEDDGDEPDADDGKAESPKDALYTLEEFTFSGVVNWGGYKFTYYSQQVLPGPGLAIPGRHVNEAGYVSDSDGYIVLAGSAPKGTVFPTPFGYEGKIYDRGTVGNHLDVYVR